MQITLSWPPRALSPNGRPNRWEKARATKAHRREAWGATLEQPLAERARFAGAVKVHVHMTFDGRSIVDLRPADLAGRTQVHLFSGIGVWSYALRLAGWPDDRPVWTASCPCQPFSTAGKGGGFDDERHLWPAAYWLISQCLPPVIIGEQVASKAAEPWIDLVHADLEALGYAFGCTPFPAAGVGAPHIRDRAYWCAIRLADAMHAERWEIRFDREDGCDRANDRREEAHRVIGARCEVRGLADTDDSGCFGRRTGQAGDGGDPTRIEPERLRDALWLADPSGSGRREERADAGGRAFGDRPEGRPAGSLDGCGDHRPGPTNGFWRDADWLGCRDGKWRPVEPGTFPLAHGASARVGRLRGYGNALNAYQAAAFIRSVMDVLDGQRVAA